MAAVARVAVDVAGGVILGMGGTGFKVAGKVIAVKGDAVTPHPPVPPHTSGPTMATGQSNFRVNGIPVCRAGDTATCGHATTGSTAFRVA